MTGHAALLKGCCVFVAGMFGGHASGLWRAHHTAWSAHAMQREMLEQWEATMTGTTFSAPRSYQDLRRLERRLCGGGGGDDAARGPVNQAVLEALLREHTLLTTIVEQTTETRAARTQRFIEALVRACPDVEAQRRDLQIVAYQARDSLEW